MMKEVWFFIFLFCGITEQSFAGVHNTETDPESAMYNRTLDLKEFDMEAHDVQLRIISQEDGRLVYSDVLKGLLADAKRLILNNLGDGHYQVNTDKKLKHSPQRFYIIDRELWIPKGEKSVILRPVVRKRGKTLAVTLMLADSGTSLKLLPDDGVKNSSFEFKKNDRVSQSINLSHLKSGSYTITITTGDHLHFQDFKF